jgi:2-iminobutanoate/2-iminopropanoate deaminase
MAVSRQPSATGASFSNAVAVEQAGFGTWVYISGQLGWDDEGNIVAGGLAAETSATFQHVVAALEAMGGSAAHLVKMTAYLTSLEEYSAYSAVRGDFFGDALPASTAVGVADLLLGACVEVDAVAFIPAD